MASKAEDTLKTLLLSRDASGNSPSESTLYDSGSEDSVVSGPSSPSAAVHSLRCRTCERLFTKSRRQIRPSKKQRDDGKHSAKGHLDHCTKLECCFVCLVVGDIWECTLKHAL